MPEKKALASLAIAYTPVAVGSPRRQSGHVFLIPNHLAMQFWWNSCAREHGITLTSSPSSNSSRQMLQPIASRPSSRPPATNLCFSRPATTAAGAGKTARPKPRLPPSYPPPRGDMAVISMRLIPCGIGMRSIDANVGSAVPTARSISISMLSSAIGLTA